MTKVLSPFLYNYLLINKLHVSKIVKVVSEVYGHQVAARSYLFKQKRELNGF